MSNYLIEEFTSYKVFLLTGLSDVAAIHIRIPSGIAVIRFSDNSESNSMVEENGKRIYKIHAASSQYSHFIDVLRNEGPLFFFYDTDENVSYITTSQEPVGEGEMKFMS